MLFQHAVHPIRQTGLFFDSRIELRQTNNLCPA
jgi:hypothetical protein